MNRLDLSLQWGFVHAMPILLILALLVAIGETLGNTPAMSALSFSLLFVWVVVMQWLVMERQGYRPGRWVSATIAGIAASAIIGMVVMATLDVANILPENMEIIPGMIMAGLILGAAQWMALRRQAAGAGWWVPASVLGFFIGGIVYSLLGNQVLLLDEYGLGFPGRYELALLIAAFAGYGVMTGLVLGWMLRTEGSTEDIEQQE